MIGKKFASEDTILKRLRFLERRVQSISTALPRSVQPVSTAVAPVVEEIINQVDADIAGIKEFRYAMSLVDDGIYTLPFKFKTDQRSWGFATCSDEDYAFFTVNGRGVVDLMGHDNVVANANTDGKLCIGTEDAQNPLQFKNRRGSTRILMIVIWYL
jgi:hypothetical protein